MPSIIKRGNRYRVLIRKQGYPTISKSFGDRQTAETYAKDIESRIERGVFLDTGLAESTTFQELVERFEKEISPSKKGHQIDLILTKRLKRDLGYYKVAHIQPFILSQYREKRLKSVKPATVKREFGLISRILTASEKEFGIYLPHGNPIRKIRVPTEPPGRDRRLKSGEWDLLMVSLESNHLMKEIVRIAVATGMRRSEICRVREQDINWDNNTLHIPTAKNGRPRTIPLSPMALEGFYGLLRLSSDTERVSALIPFQDPHSITQAFKRACKRAGIEGLRFHDLRHEATSRFFEKGLNVMEVASITGHQDLRMLRRYTHIRAETLVDRL
ncbi:MAG: site-specific integrase [Candidatus Sedimenticola sp. (ex Thyasira tokunagai)]